VLAENACGAKLIRVGIHDSFSETGDYESLQKKYGIDAASIAAAVKGSLTK